MINALLEPYVIAGRVRGREGADFYLDKHRTSRIMNGQADVPLALRRVELQHGLGARVARECALLFDETLDPALADEFKADVVGQINGEDARQAKLKERLICSSSPEQFVATALIAAIGAENKVERGGVLWRKGSGSLCWRIGDLFRFGFGNRKKARNLVVIPVDREFRTHVTRRYEDVPLQEVSERSLHGQWLIRMAQSGVLEGDLAGRIRDALDKRGVFAGADGAYPCGSVAPIDASSATYLLLAIARFDENGMARAAATEIEEAIIALLRYYDENGQGADLYIPLVGTGLSRSGIGKRESFDLIQSVVTDKSPFVGGKVTIVVPPDDVKEIGLDG